MRLCLIYPPDKHMIRTNVPSVVSDVTGYYPPLGLLYVAGAVERAGSHEVHVIDCAAERLENGQLADRIRCLHPDVVGIQALTFSLVDFNNTAALVKQAASSAPVVAGGPHANLFPEETLALENVDYVLLGEGENNINPFLEALSGQRDPASVPGICYRDSDGGVRRGPPNPLIDDLDALPDPARHLLRNELYASVLGRGSRLTTIMSSRGCPAKCVFCDRPHLGKRFRSRSARNVVDEMQSCREDFGVDEFFFYDDTFTIDRQRVFDICGEIKARGLELAWDVRTRVASIDREMLEVMAETGCKRVHLGIESGNRQVLRAMRKGLDLARAREAFRWCRQTGIESLAYFMVGSPGEGPPEIRDTLRFALSIDCDYVHVSVTTPFPGTELYRMGLDSGLFATDYWRDFAAHPSADFIPRVWDAHLSRDELVRHMMGLYRRFYSRPGYLARRLSKVRSLRELKTKAAAGIKLLRRTLTG
jgi:radical SAM superfamily enzyme YgiQ (UPF0313 family)